MSPVALGLNVLLAVLLLVAVFTGWKLNRKLKGLRDGQASFVKAVQELDVAAARAEAGLKALRAAQEDTHDSLLTRIETARGLINRLEAATERAAVVAPPALAKAAPASQPVAPPLRAQAPAARPLPPRPGAREIDDDLFVDDERPAARGGFRR